MVLSKEAKELFLEQGKTQEEVDAIQQVAGEVVKIGKPVLMEKERGRFRKKKTVFDLRTETQRLLHRLFH